jgi:hypothetical protein
MASAVRRGLGVAAQTFTGNSTTGGKLRFIHQHYYLQLLQVPHRLLKTDSAIRRSQYALFKPRFSTNSFIDSFGGGTL